MRTYYSDPRLNIVSFDTAEQALKQGFDREQDLQELVNMAFKPLTPEYWTGSPSESWTRERINEELVEVFNDVEDWCDDCIGRNGYQASAFCIKDIAAQVLQRIKSDARFEAADAWHFKGEE